MSGPSPGVGPTPEPGSPQDGRGEGGKNPDATATNEPKPDQPSGSPSDLATLEAANTQLKADAAASARQEQANRLALQQAQQQNVALQTQIQQQVEEPTTDLPGISDHAKSLKKAMFDGDEAGIDTSLKGVIAEASKAGAAEAQKNADESAKATLRRSAVQSYFTPYIDQFNNATDPITVRTLQLYGQLQGSGTMSWVPEDSVSIQISPGYNQDVNLHILKEAHQMAIIENPSDATTPTEPEYIEGSGRGGGPRNQQQRPSAPSARKMLNEGEIETAIRYWDGDPKASEDDILKDYFEHFSPEIKAARKRTGGPVSAVDLVAAGMMSKE